MAIANGASRHERTSPFYLLLCKVIQEGPDLLRRKLGKLHTPQAGDDVKVAKLLITHIGTRPHCYLYAIGKPVIQVLCNRLPLGIP